MRSLKYRNKRGISNNNFLMKLIAVICLFLTLSNFLGTTKVYAGSETGTESWGGVLIKPVVNLLTAIADGIIGLLNKNIEKQATTFIKIDGTSDWWSKWGAKVLGIIVGVVISGALIAAMIGSGGAAVLGAGVVLKIYIPMTLVNATGGYLIADVMDGTYFPEDIYLPVFRVSLDNIFYGNIPLLDVNFFQPMESKEVHTYGEDYEEKILIASDSYIYNNMDYLTNDLKRHTKIDVDGYTDKELSIAEIQESEYIKDVIERANNSEKLPWLIEDNCKLTISQSSSNNVIRFYIKNENNQEIIIEDTHSKITHSEERPYAYYQSTGSWYQDVYDSTSVTTCLIEIRQNVVSTEIVESTAAQLRGVISTWYFILRNVAMLVLMLVLIYIGIRIVVGSTAGEKAKYKERLVDWLVALCLVFVMHYIMVFAVEIVERITELVVKTAGTYERGAIIKLTDSQYDDIVNNKKEIATQVTNDKILYWNTDLMGQIKIYSQQEKEGTENWVGMAVGYVVLVFYTVFFIWTYLRRVLYMAFLTMVSPLVAMTYPIDKINDGKAQAFNIWFREYIFNLLIQPMHLLLYNVLVVSAYELAAESVIYTLVAIGFMIPAEKLVRKFFGFEKAQTPGLLSGAAGAALAMTGIQQLKSHHPKGGKGGQRGAGGDESKETDSKGIRTAKNNSSDIYEGLANSGTIPESQSMNAGLPVDGESGTIPKSQRMSAELPVDEESGTIPKSQSMNAGLSVDEESETIPKSQSMNAKPSGESNGKTTMPNSGDGNKVASKKAPESKWAKLGRTIKGVSSEYGRQMGQKVMKRIQQGRTIRAMAKGAAGLLGAATLGATGIALGIASGDPSKVAQYGAAGALAGYGAASGTAASAVDAFSVDSDQMREEAEMSWYGEEYANHKFKEKMEKDLKSEKYIKRVRTLTGWSEDEARGFLDNIGRECYESGVTDVEDMLAIKTVTEEEDDKKRVPTVKQAILATKLKNKLPQSINSMTTDTLEKYEKTYRKGFESTSRAQHPDWDDKKIKQQVETDTQNTIRYIQLLDSAKPQ